MRKSVFLLLAIVSVAVFSACGSSGSGASCDSVCNKVGECLTPSDKTGCLQGCPVMKDSMRSSVFDKAASCILDTPCGVNFNPDTCLLSGLPDIPASVLSGLAATLCTKANECDSQVDVETCKTEFMTDNDIQFLRAFKDSVLNCMGDCVSQKTCEQLGQDIEGVSAACGCSCGIVFFCED